MGIGEKIKAARKNAGKTQLELSKITNLSRSYIGDIEKDRYNPSVNTLQLIAQALNCDVASFLGGNPATHPALIDNPIPGAMPITKMVRLPLLNQFVAAGEPIDPGDPDIEWVTIPMIDADADADRDFVITVSGDSMAPTIVDGDYVVIRKVYNDNIPGGRIGVFRVSEDYEYTLKRVRYRSDKIILIADNPDTDWGEERVYPRRNVEIFGQVLLCFRNV